VGVERFLQDENRFISVNHLIGISFHLVWPSSSQRQSYTLHKGISSHMDMQWLNESRCLTEDPELFFPVGNTGPAVDQIDQAKAVCRECNVATQCLEYAIKENQDTGVWGGLSEDERKSLKRKYARARRAG
jgi:WhiB family redox-sensing transcriptional regulator